VALLFLRAIHRGIGIVGGDLLQPKANPTDKKGFKTEVLKPLMSAFSREG
jgi:hypothetical protein